MSKQKIIHHTLMTSVITAALFATFSVHAEELTVDQHNKTVVVDGNKVEAITVHVGDTVRFKNEDPFFHNIFSLSDLKTFDLGSFPKGQSKTVTFDKAGMVEVECAIHPEMYMEVTVK